MNDITITRAFDAPVAKVWTVWTGREYFAQWFGAPLPTVVCDVRPGGTWRATVTTPQGEMPLGGTYRDVVPHERLVWTMGAPDGGEVVLDATFTDHGDKTEVALHQAGIPAEHRAATEAGAHRILDGFASVLAKA
ncbi:SRPBCC domain-containing protein [Streptomyces sp. NPDC088354]|uniref:SRPBCC family protein n=1 Tax=unclassified Streptomyces TaxID=2593676 RepID=UPI0029AAC12C|nr:SRPBCC domain-containing protein [Streptomyces sp. MI02-7b]MDX3077922.1 SRPBCC domain-containing protein [Streptomyces sp. MI02-7b]